MKKLLVALLSGCLVACSGGSEENTEDAAGPTRGEGSEETTSTAQKELEELRFQLDVLILNHGTAPATALIALKSEGMEVFHPEYTNDTTQVDKYNTDFSVALNFGVYKTDLVYDLIHHDLEDGFHSQSAANRLSDQLWEEKMYSDEDIEAFKAAADDDEALAQLIYDDYEEIEQYMASHEQFEIATLVLCGSLIESMYFTSEAIEEHGISELKYNLLINEKHMLDGLIELLDHFNDNEKDKALNDHLKKLVGHYADLTTFADADMEVISAIDQEVFSIRERIIRNEF